jgi:CubicO group peptidase (beta-lactamase class C family)
VRSRASRLPLLLLVVALAAGPTLAAGPPTAAGHWEGAIDIPGARLSIDVDLAGAADGGWSGDISIPSQGARNLALAAVSASGTDVAFEIPGTPGSPTFHGTLSENGAAIAGTFTQGGQTFPFALERRESAAAAAGDALAGLDGFVDAALVDWEVPGLALVVVRDGQVVLAKGFGLRDVKNKLPVTERTLFAIGSSTKAFTTFVLGTLVDEGKLAWDRPVREYIPEFKLEDPSTSQRITPRDLCTHRSGLPRHDAVWYNATELTRKELVERLAHLEASADLRAKWQYNNLMFLTAGYLAERITGESWEDAVRHRIFEPLGMTGSNFSVADSQKSPDFALPYEDRDDRIQEVPFRTVTNMGPAGSINSNAVDLARWLEVHLEGGKVGTRTVIRKETLDEIHSPQMAMGRSAERPEISAPAYAMGWFVTTYRGHLRVEHGGNIDGFSAEVCLFPDDGVGIAVVANLGGTGLPGILVSHVADRVLSLPTIDWNAEALGKRALAKGAVKEAEKKKDVARKPGTKPSHPLADYAGDYANEGYGTSRIALVGDHLEWTFNGITAPLEHWHYDVWNAAKGAKDPALEDTRLLFRTNVKGNIDSFSAALEPAVAGDRVRERPEAACRDPPTARFPRHLRPGGPSFTVGIHGSRLTLSVAGQPTHELIPDQDDEFAIEGLSGFSVRFVAGDAGVTALELRQPNGVFTARKQGK